MPDDPTQRDGQDRARIIVSQDHERRYWAFRFGVSIEELEDAVKQVGDRADKVEQFLKDK